MKKITTKSELDELILTYGRDILASPRMQTEKTFAQHGGVNCFEHSVSVAYRSLYLAALFHVDVDQKSLIRGALLHDYFLYDWHTPDKTHRLHGFHHAKRALANAKRDFSLNEKEQDIIVKHMFPLNLRLPQYKESLLVILADKWCATHELLSVFSFIPKVGVAEKLL